MTFTCNTCKGTRYDRRELRGDGKGVLFCAVCGMGMVEDPPASTDFFYEDGYYGADQGDAAGYHDYELTASHTQLWVRLLIERLVSGPARILDIGCADGSMLSELPDRFDKAGIEANATAARKAAARGVVMLTNDIADPVVMAQKGSFDVVSSIATFEHVLDMRGAIEIALALLKADGLLVLEVPLISETADNKDWYHGSYEHISYPTVRGMAHLLNSFAGLHWVGFEAPIKGFSSSYIAVATLSSSAFETARALVETMRSSGDPAVLPPEQQQLNLAYHLVRSFDPTPERVLALPALFEVTRSRALLRRLSQLWYDDCVKARQAEYFEQQASNWQAAWKGADQTMVALQAELARRDALPPATQEPATPEPAPLPEPGPRSASQSSPRAEPVPAKRRWEIWK